MHRMHRMHRLHRLHHLHHLHRRHRLQWRSVNRSSPFMAGLPNTPAASTPASSLLSRTTGTSTEMPTAAAIDNPGLVERVCGKTSGDGPGVDARDVSGLDGSLGPGLMDDPSTLRALGPLDFDEDTANLLRTWFDDTFLHERACVQGIPVDCHHSGPGSSIPLPPLLWLPRSRPAP